MRLNGMSGPTHRVHGTTPLLLAARGGEAEVVRGLLRLRAGVEEREQKDDPAWYVARGTSALHVCGHVDVARALLDESADLEARDDNGSPPLFGAAMRGDLAVLHLLLEARYYSHSIVRL